MTREIEARLRLSAVDNTKKAFNAVGKRFNEVDRRAKDYNRTQTAVARTQRAMGNEMALMATRVFAPVAIAAGVRRTVSAAADFEEALFNIQKKAGATEEQMAKIKSEIIDLGDEVPVSLDEIAKAFERLAAAGIPLDDLKEMAKLTAQVADSWDMTAEDVANAFAGFEKGMNIPRDELEQFADLINYLADSGIADEVDIVNFIDRVGASLKAVGLKRDDIAAIGAAMVNLKMKAEVAARAMDTLMGRLAAPENLADKSREALAEIVGDLDKFRELMGRDAKEGLLFFLGELEKFSGQKRISLLGALMGQGFDDEVARIVGGLEEVKRNLKLVQDESAYKGSIAGLSEKRMELFNSQLTTMKNTVSAIGIEIGNWAMPAIQGPLSGVQDALQRNSSIEAGWKKAALPGQDRDDVLRDFRKRWRQVNSDDPLGIGSERAFNQAAYELGTGVINSLYEGLERQAAAKRREQQIAGMRDQLDEAHAAYAPRYRPPGAVPTLPTGRSDFRPHLAGRQYSEAEQRALYGRGRESARFYGGYEQVNRGREALAGIADRIEQAQAAKEAAREAARELADGGEQAKSKMAEGSNALHDAATAIRQAADYLRGLIGSASFAGRAAAPAVNADTGRSGGDVAAGPQ